MGEWARTNDGRPLKTIDAALDKISALVIERDQARIDLAVERVAHRVTKKELAEVTDLALSR